MFAGNTYMADSRVQIDAEDWVRRTWMPANLGGTYSRERLRLTPGGSFDFDAVAPDGQTAAVISTNGGITASGKAAKPKLNKIRSDCLFLLMTHAKRRLVLLTDKDMYDLCIGEKNSGRMPTEIEFFHCPVPDELEQRLAESRKKAAEEVTPK
jgi:hypothetical protein